MLQPNTYIVHQLYIPRHPHSSTIPLKSPLVTGRKKITWFIIFSLRSPSLESRRMGKVAIRDRKGATRREGGIMSLKRSRFTELSSRIEQLVCTTRDSLWLLHLCRRCYPRFVASCARTRSTEITHPKTRAAAHAYDPRASALLRVANEPRSSISCQLTGYESRTRLAIN